MREEGAKGVFGVGGGRERERERKRKDGSGWVSESNEWVFLEF